MSQTASMPRPRVKEQATARDKTPNRQIKVSGLIAMFFLFLSTIYFFLPFFWLLVSSTKNTGDLFGTFGLWFAPNFNLFSNLQQLFTYDNSIYLQWLLNSFIYSGVSSIVAMFVSAMTGYALAKYNFRGRNLLFSGVLGAILVPTTALALPLYLLMNQWGLTNTYWSVLIPSLVSPFGVYLSRIYASASVPDELIEAARIDGAGELNIFVNIAMRLMTPALVTILLFQFVAVWNNYFLPLVMLSNEKLFPITLGLQTWNVTTGGGNKFLYTQIVTGALISSIPLIIGCIVLQRFWKGGLGVGSVKN
jgi:multiple sugar transport system permease protein